jgi:Patatin-like phospholipase
MDQPTEVRLPIPERGNDDPTTFADVLQHELVRINDSRERRRVGAEAHTDNLIGLAFSGGGIRSATFNLGILQGLAQKGRLHQFDYLSTVSGGGYIGSWLAALTRRLTKEFNCTYEGVEKALSPHKYTPETRAEPMVLHWLRLYSNYLTPHSGVISGDTWAMLGTWIRNVVLNQAILALIFIGIVTVCQSVLLPLVLAENDGRLFLWSGVGILAVACILMAINVVQEAPSTVVRQKTWFQRSKVTTTVMLPFVLSCLLMNCALWQRTDYGDIGVGWWALAGAVFYFVVWGVVAIMAWIRRGMRERRGKPMKLMISILALLVFSPIAGAAGGCLFRAYVLLLRNLGDWTSTNWIVIVFGTGMVMLIMLIAGTLHVGLVGRGSMDLVREWWARLGGYLSLITLGWLLFAGTCVFAPLGLRWAIFELKGWKSISAGLLWLLHNYVGLKAASSGRISGQENAEPKTKKDANGQPCEGSQEKPSVIMEALKSPQILNRVAQAAPYVFIVGLVVLLGSAIQIATGLAFKFDLTKELWTFNSKYDWSILSGDYWLVVESGSAQWLGCVGAICFLAGIALSWRVDVNDFSLHYFYRNRLVRCYLGASNSQRKPEPFTGFDPSDDIPLCDFADNYAGPYPIINASLNITGGEELGYATRRAKSFVFTPLYCGYELGASGDGALQFICDDGYVPSYSKTQLGRTARGVAKFGCDCGISLGTAMAISGAAASPNMGYHTSAATAFYMTLFDVRLGWWMGNPRNAEKWRSTGPALGLGYLFSEVLAQSDQQRGYVYLSDGGHFENLAVYELIRRRCRLIVVGDAGCDLQYGFGDLLSLIEKARTDFGTRIEIDYEAIRPTDGGRQSDHNCIIGTIYYDPADCEDTGILILIKASMPKRQTPADAPRLPNDRKLPDDVWRYYDQHKTFPHQSTGDQWFDELQFESYRALGEYIGVQAADKIGAAVEHTLARPKPSFDWGYYNPRTAGQPLPRVSTDDGTISE